VPGNTEENHENLSKAASLWDEIRNWGVVKKQRRIVNTTFGLTEKNMLEKVVYERSWFLAVR
jgi:hypothetical protein